MDGTIFEGSREAAVIRESVIRHTADIPVRLAAGHVLLRIQTMEYTQEQLNEWYHWFIAQNTGVGNISTTVGHLQWVRGRGVVKTEEATCSLCYVLGSTTDAGIL